MQLYTEAGVTLLNMADDFGFLASDNGVHAVEDPAAAFLAQQESEIAVIENDSSGFGALEDGGPPPANTYTAFGGNCVTLACLLALQHYYHDTLFYYIIIRVYDSSRFYLV